MITNYAKRILLLTTLGISSMQAIPSLSDLANNVQLKKTALIGLSTVIIGASAIGGCALAGLAGTNKDNLVYAGSAGAFAGIVISLKLGKLLGMKEEAIEAAFMAAPLAFIVYGKFGIKVSGKPLVR
ncbi:MAG: hypothetical protein WA432_04790 [Candidatus Babeliaceae bacterium]